MAHLWCDAGGLRWPGGYALFRAWVAVGDVWFEPMTAIAISRCARSQQENRCDRIILSAAAGRENQSFMLSVARCVFQISKSRTFLPSDADL